MALTSSKVLQRRARKLLQKSVLELSTLEDRSTPAVTGIVFQDYNANGFFDTGAPIANNGTGTSPTAADRGVAGVTVTAYDATNTVVGTAVSGADGAYTLQTSTTGAVRVEFTGLPAGVFFGPSGMSSNSAVQFVDANQANVNLSLVRPEDYSANNPQLVTSVYVFGGSTANDENPADGVILSTPASAGSADGDPTLSNYLNPATHDLSVRQDNVGATWGLAYNSSTGKLYAAAFMKRHSGFGPAGPGAIYQTNLTGSTASLYTDLNSIFGDKPAGNLADVFRDSANNPVPFLRNYTSTEDWARDGLVRFTDVNGVVRDLGWDAVGKISLGGLATNADNTKMYTVALGDRRLYAVPTGGVLNASTVQRFDLPVPATVTGRTASNPLGDLRPFAVEYYRGLIYVGAVNSAEATQNRNDLKAYVFAFDPAKGAFVNAARQATTTEAVLTIDLNYDRGHVHMAGESNGRYPNGIAPPDPAEWNPWSPTIKKLADQPEAIGRSDYPQPWLTGLSFDPTGNIVLGIRDRAGDQFGRLTAEDPFNPNVFVYFGMTAGDTLRAFINTPGNLDAAQANPALPLAGWTLESNGRSPTGAGTAPQNSGQGPGGGEFYYQDDLPRDPSKPPIGVATEHDEVSVGGVVQIPGTNQVITTAFDPVRIPGVVNTGGFRWYDNTTGQTTKQYQIYSTPIAPGAHTFAKANGVGDLIAVGGPAPVEIGNYVWNDANKNGIQDAGEQALAGVTLNLYAAGNDGKLGTADDQLLGSAATDANGNYYFSSVAGTSTASRVLNLPLTPNTAYQLRLPTGQQALLRKEATITGAGNASIDNNAVTAGANLVVNVQTGAAGQADHTFDIGVIDSPLVSIGNFVWNDANNNGVFDVGEAGIAGVTVNLYAADGTTFLGTQQTNANGNYQFDNLRAGGYVVEVIPPANFASSTGKNGFATGPYEPGIVGNFNNQDHGTTQANGNVRAAVVALAAPGDLSNPDTNGLAPNNANFTVDFGLFRLQSVGDFVWNDANNNGKFDAGETPIANVPVALLDGSGAVLATTVTDATGGYRFGGLGTGTYSVRITAPGGFVSSTGTVGSPTGPYEPAPQTNNNNEDHGTTAGGVIQTLPFVLNAPGFNPDDGGFANFRQDFGLFRPVSVGNFVWDDANNNGFFDTGESPLANVPVTLLDGNGVQVGTATTDANGNYLFTNLVPGQYIIRVATPIGYASSTGNPAGGPTGPFEPAPQTTVDNSDHGTAIGSFVQSVVTLAAPGSADNPDNGGLANLRQDFGFYRPLAVGDFVWVDANNNGLVDTGEKGLGGVRVDLLDQAGNTLASTATDANGNYLFTGLGTGTYSVRIFTPAGYASSTGANGAFEPAPQTNNNNQDHGTAVGAVIQTPPLALGTPGSGTNPDNGGLANLRQDFGLFPLLTIGNLVWFDANNNGKLDATEKGVAGVTVRLLDANLATIATTTTDGTGGYLFTNLFPGTYSVEIDRPSGRVSSTGTPNSPTGPYEVAPGGTLADNPNDSEDKGNTLPGGDVIRAKPVTLLAFGNNPDLGGVANIRQDFGLTTLDQIVPPPPPPPQNIPAGVSGYVYRDTFQANGVRQPANGEAGISQVTVTLLDANKAVVGTTKTNADGYYEFRNLPAGPYTIVETQPPAWIDGLDTPGSLGGTSPSNDVLTVTLAPGDFGLEYNFGEVLPDVVPPPPPPPVSPPPPPPSKDDFLGSSPNGGSTSPPSGAPPIQVNGPTFANPLNTANPRFVLVSGGAGALPEVRAFDYSSGSERYRIQVYENTFLGGVRVAQGDVDGDGVDDIITGTGVGGGPRIKVYSGATGQVIRDFFAFEPTFRGGIFVAAGDLDGDGKADIVVGAEVGGGPRITTFSGANPAVVLNNFFAFDPNQRGGTRVAVGDFNGDGRADIVASTGQGVPTRIKVLDGTNVGNTLIDFTPFEAGFTGGTNIAVGDYNGDGKPDIITGAEAGGGPRVQVFSGLDLSPLASFFAFPSSFSGGTRVAAQDVNGDGKDDIVVGSGAGRAAETVVFNANGLGVIDDFNPVDTFGGIYVG